MLRVQEHTCEVAGADGVRVVRFAPMFPSPRLERVFPGHLVAVAATPQGRETGVWRWYDAVVLGDEGQGGVRLWEPGHGEVVARARPSYEQQPAGSRAYASAGLPNADFPDADFPDADYPDAGWWVADNAARGLTAVVELDDVDALYTQNGLWASVFD